MFNKGDKKQILGYKFICLENEIKVVNPENLESFYEYQEAEKFYKMLYASKYVDNIVDEVIKKLGLNMSKIHLWDYETLKKVELNLKKELSNHQINLQFQSVVTRQYGIHLSGNIDGITANIICWLFKNGWHKIEISYSDLQKYFKHHKNAKLYKLGEYWSVVEIPKSKVESLDLSNKIEHYGYGSCSSIGLRSVTLWQDKKYNLCVDERFINLD